MLGLFGYVRLNSPNFHSANGDIDDRLGFRLPVQFIPPLVEFSLHFR